MKLLFLKYVCIDRIGNWGKINIGKTPIPNLKSPIGHFITNWRFPMLVLKYTHYKIARPT